MATSEAHSLALPLGGKLVHSFPPQGGASEDGEAPFHKAQSSDVEAPLGSKLLSSEVPLQAGTYKLQSRCSKAASCTKLTISCGRCCRPKASMKLRKLLAAKLSCEAFLLKLSRLEVAQSSRNLKLQVERQVSSSACKLLSLPSSLPEAFEDAEA